jgi:FKBP-type peptidyl-prolyl cis-trans isomerase
MKLVLFFPVFFSILVGCTSYSEHDKAQFDSEIKAFLKLKKTTCNVSPSGLHYRIDSIGEGRFIQFQDSVSISYTGKLLSGTIVDQQVKPMSFAVRDLIPAWKEILLELKKGGQAYMVIPPHLGYGSNQLDKIPPHSILEFTLRVNEVK